MSNNWNDPNAPHGDNNQSGWDQSGSADQGQQPDQWGQSQQSAGNTWDQGQQQPAADQWNQQQPGADQWGQSQQSAGNTWDQGQQQPGADQWGQSQQSAGNTWDQGQQQPGADQWGQSQQSAGNTWDQGQQQPGADQWNQQQPGADQWNQQQPAGWDQGAAQQPYGAAPGYGATPGYGVQAAPGAKVHPMLGIPLADWGKRALGGLLDFVLPGFIAGIILSLIFAPEVTSTSGGVSVTQTNNWPNIIFSLLLYLALAFVSQHTGQSWGRKIAKTQLVGEDGRPIGLAKSFIRYLLHYVDSFICLIGWLFPLWDSKRQTIADKIMKTYVIDVSQTGPVNVAQQ
ncbi:RDD family protein [Propionibacteriaceae bacterium G1746]